MKSPVVKRSIVLRSRRTSVSLEEPFWTSLKEIAKTRGDGISELVETIAGGGNQGNLSSAIRLFVLEYFRGAEHILHARKPGAMAGLVTKSAISRKSVLTDDGHAGS